MCGRVICSSGARLGFTCGAFLDHSTCVMLWFAAAWQWHRDQILALDKVLPSPTDVSWSTMSLSSTLFADPYRTQVIAQHSRRQAKSCQTRCAARKPDALGHDHALLLRAPLLCALGVRFSVSSAALLGPLHARSALHPWEPNRHSRPRGWRVTIFLPWQCISQHDAAAMSPLFATS